MQNLRKKGYIFMLDAFIAIVIVLIGTLFFYYHLRPENEDVFITEQLSEDIVGVLSFTKISDLCINPGVSASSGCSCPSYDKLGQIVCNPNKLKDLDANLLSMMAELISTNSVNGKIIEDLIHDIFVKKNVVDETRFGFSILYTDPISTWPLELYNTETYP